MPVLHEDNGRGYVAMAQEAENVYWRCGLLGVDKKGMIGFQLMCNSEDRSNFWSIDVEYESAILSKQQEHQLLSGKHHFAARKYLTLKFPLEACKNNGNKEKGILLLYRLKIVSKTGIRPKKFHNFSIPEKNLCNVILIVEGKKIHCTMNVDETLELATNLKSDSARQRCERWLSKTQLMSAKKKMKLAEKHTLVELQNECVTMLKTSQQIQRLFKNPHDFSDTEILELMDRVTSSIVGHSFDGFGK
ncbi:hypothetical protein CAEBREN_02066 [Caenorhabditis brenneri]|uniref:MATH domain-containing protein n=1 Tax=Caenorhabditis brenneri TaxID=135651 RepID=G0MSE3_CAEBE|nr:hypothetical protein CAEBREN_02066 [Caenorhabditis brenneri]